MTDALTPLAALAGALEAGRLDCEFPGDDVPSEMIEIYAGRGGNRLLTLRHAFTAREVLKAGAPATSALQPLARIADAFDANDLDDGARKFWGRNLEHENTTAPAEIGLVFSRGGATLLTLAHALAARSALTEMAA